MTFRLRHAVVGAVRSRSRALSSGVLRACARAGAFGSAVGLTLLGIAGLAAAQPSQVIFVVPATPIKSGQVIREVDLGERRLLATAGAASSHATDRNEVVGKIARRPLAVGAPITLSSIGEPTRFKRGDRVKILLQSGALMISAQGIALEPGIVGRDVLVRNADTGVQIRGVAGEDGVVVVGAGP